MADQKHVELASALFRELLAQDRVVPKPESASPSLGEDARRISIPHPYYVVDGNAVLGGEFAGAERMTGYQSLVLEGETPVEILIASMAGEDVAYAAGWPRRAAEALTEALRVAERNGITDVDFAVVTVPEVAFNAVGFQSRHELIPLGMSSKKSDLDPSRVYSEREVIEELQRPLRARFAIVGAGVEDDKTPKPPRA